MHCLDVEQMSEGKRTLDLKEGYDKRKRANFESKVTGLPEINVKKKRQSTVQDAWPMEKPFWGR